MGGGEGTLKVQCATQFGQLLNTVDNLRNKLFDSLNVIAFVVIVSKTLGFAALHEPSFESWEVLEFFFRSSALHVNVIHLRIEVEISD